MNITQTLFSIVILVITIPLGFALYKLRKAEEEAERRQNAVLDVNGFLKGQLRREENDDRKKDQD